MIVLVPFAPPLRARPGTPMELHAAAAHLAGAVRTAISSGDDQLAVLLSATLTIASEQGVTWQDLRDVIESFEDWKVKRGDVCPVCKRSPCWGGCDVR